ncbi:hypothetical protein HDU98_000131, partial [Podochytrium sp. JEL0797]
MSNPRAPNDYPHPHPTPAPSALGVPPANSAPNDLPNHAHAVNADRTGSVPRPIAAGSSSASGSRPPSQSQGRSIPQTVKNVSFGPG